MLEDLDLLDIVQSLEGGLASSDINGFPVAGRRFKSSEYLSGALLKLKSLPAKTPLHLSLSIFDPGEEAINYHVTFHEEK